MPGPGTTASVAGERRAAGQKDSCMRQEAANQSLFG